MLGKVDGGDFDFLLFEQLGDLIGTEALHCQAKNLANHGGSLVVNYPLFPLFAGLKIVVRDVSGHMLSTHALSFENRFNFPANATDVKLVSDIIRLFSTY